MPTPNIPEDGPVVRLPLGPGRTLEAYHALAWSELLSRAGAAEVLASHAARQLGTPSEAAAAGATVERRGQSGSDLFLVCGECQGDRMVIEIKGPTARVNWRRKLQVWQPIHYRDVYRSNPALACHLMPNGAPVLVFLDARNRTAKQIEEQETCGAPVFEGWAVLPYRPVLADPMFAGEHSRWLLSE